MADEYRPEDYERDEQERYRSQRRGQFDYSGGERYAGGYEGAGPGRFDDERYRERESAPSGRYGQGQSSSRYGQQGWERQQQPDQYSRPNEWSRRLREGEWQRQQQWELEGGPSAGWLPEESRGRGGYRPEGSYGQPPAGNRGGPYGMEYPESAYQSPGGYGEMYRGSGEMYAREGTYGRYVGRGPKGYTRSDDRIRDDVCERLTQAWDVDAEDIEVKVKGGEVTLSGSVMDRYQKRMAEDAIYGVPGVRDVNNQLRAGGSGSTQQGPLASATGQYRPAPAGRATRTTSSAARPKAATSSTRGTASRSSSGSRGGSTPGATVPRSTPAQGQAASDTQRSPDPFQPESRG